MSYIECQIGSEEQRKCQEEKLRGSYESELAKLEEKHIQLTEMFRETTSSF